MNKNIIGIILIILALAAVYFYGWPKLQPYLNTGGAEGVQTEGIPGEPGMPGTPPNPAPQPQ